MLLSISFAMRILQHLTDQEAGPPLGLQVDFPDILADDPQGEEDQPADGPHRADHAGPADDRVPARPADDGVDQHEEAHGKDEEPQAGDVADGLDGQGSDALHGEGEHLLERVLALAGEPLPPLVLHGAGAVADHGHDAPQEQVDLLELGQPLQRPPGHEAVVGVVEHRLRPHEIHHPVEPLGGEPLEESVLLPGGAHAVNNVAPGVVLLHHGIHRVDVVLQIRVHGDGHVAPIRRYH